MPNPLVSERTITSALKALRQRTVREGRPGLEHVEALLAIRGDNLAPVPRPAPANKLRKGEMRRLITAALRDGPKPLREIAQYIVAQRPALAYWEAYRRASLALPNMKRAGVVGHQRPLWSLLVTWSPQA